MCDLPSCLHGVEYAPMYRVNHSLEFTNRPEVLAGNADFITQGGNGVLIFREPKVNVLNLWHTGVTVLMTCAKREQEKIHILTETTMIERLKKREALKSYVRGARCHNGLFVLYSCK